MNETQVRDMYLLNAVTGTSAPPSSYQGDWECMDCRKPVVRIVSALTVRSPSLPIYARAADGGKFTVPVERVKPDIQKGSALGL